MKGVGIRVIPDHGIDLIAISNQEIITIEDIRRAAWAVNGTEAGVHYFMTHRHAAQYLTGWSFCCSGAGKGELSSSRHV